MEDLKKSSEILPKNNLIIRNSKSRENSKDADKKMKAKFLANSSCELAESTGPYFLFKRKIGVNMEFIQKIIDLKQEREDGDSSSQSI